MYIGMVNGPEVFLDFLELCMEGCFCVLAQLIMCVVLVVLDRLCTGSMSTLVFLPSIHGFSTGFNSWKVFGQVLIET